MISRAARKTQILSGVSRIEILSEYAFSQHSSREMRLRKWDTTHRRGKAVGLEEALFEILELVELLVHVLWIGHGW
jgi:hypothetical protein